MKKFLVLLLAVMTVLCIVACDKDDDADLSTTYPDNAKLVGTWEGDLDFTAFMESYMADYLGGDYFDFTPAAIRLVYTFNGTKMTIEADQKASASAIESLVNDLCDGMNAYAAALGQDLGMTADELYDYCEELVVESFVESFTAESSYYAVDGDKIYNVADEDDLADEVAEGKNYFEFTLNGDVLTIVDIVDGGQGSADVMLGALPLTLNKQ